MKTFVMALSFFYSLSSFAATPLVQYDWHSQVVQSQVTIYSDGSISHTERSLYHRDTINENPLSQEKLEEVRSLVKELSGALTKKVQVKTALGSRSGGVTVFVKSKPRLVEGIDRTGIDEATGYKTQARDAIEDLKAIIFKYSRVDMEF